MEIPVLSEVVRNVILVLFFSVIMKVECGPISIVKSMISAHIELVKVVGRIWVQITTIIAKLVTSNPNKCRDLLTASIQD